MGSVTPFVLYSLQILVVVATAAVGVATVRLTPRVRFTYWRLVIALCLALPLMPARVIEVPAIADGAIVAAMTHAGPVAAVARADARSLAPFLPMVLIAGALLRAVWLAAGLAQLGRLKREGEPATLDPELAALRRAIAPQAEIRWHARVAQPVTFGVRRPIVLLPFRLRDLDSDLQRSVVCHELVHADRGDWIATVLEEILRTAFWFHPAIWWAIGQLQLCREETVDALAIQMTGSRRSYLQALLAFADSPALASAPLFARRHQLAHRIKELSQEVVMSRTRLGVCALAVVALTLGSAWAVASTLPLRTEVRYSPPAATVAVPQTPRTAVPPPPPPPPPPPQDGKTNPRVVAEAKAQYPPEALRYSPGATVWVKVTIGGNGEVTEAKASRWRLTIEQSIEDPNYWASKPERAFIDAAETAALKWKFAAPDANTRTAIELMFTFRNIPGAAAVGPQPDVTRNGATVVRVGGDIRPPAKIRDVQPVYPADALAANVQGVVILELHIGVDGSVLDATVMRSIRLLDEAAVEAVRLWRYTPTLLNGVPVEVIMTVTVNFIS